MTERKYPVGGFAPGNYYCHCANGGANKAGNCKWKYKKTTL